MSANTKPLLLLGGLGALGLLALTAAAGTSHITRAHQMTTTRFQELFQDGSKWLLFALRAALPCSNLTAAFLIALTGRWPSNPLDAGAWRKLDRRLWDAVNITDAMRPWSGLEIAAKRFDRAIIHIKPDQRAPALPPGKLWLVQRWRIKGPLPITQGRDNGHSYLVYSLQDGTYFVVQSNVKRGLSRAIQPQYHTHGYETGVVEVPLA
jgi:hypothetical protein